MAFATSSGRPGRARGILRLFTYHSLKSSVSVSSTPSINDIAVLIHPGATAFASLPYWERSTARVRVHAPTPPLLALYAPTVGSLAIDCVDHTLTLRPPPLAIMPGTTSLAIT